MTLSFFATLILVTAGTALAAHAIVRWARRRGAASETATALAIAAGTTSVGLALQAQGPLAAGLQFGGLALILVALLALIRGRSGSLS